jgi:hypothetical protein
MLLAATAMLALLAVPTRATAQQWEGTLGLQQRHWNNTEHDPAGRQLVREAGWLPGLAARAAYQDHGLTWFAQASLHDKAIAYHGQTQAGQARDSSTALRLALLRIGAACEINASNAHDIHDIRDASLALFATLEWERSTRNIAGAQGATGLQERTDARRISAGIRKKWRRDGSGALFADAAVVLAAPERLRVGFSGMLDPAALNTPSSQGLRLGAGMRPDFAPQLELHLVYDWFKVARSGDVPITINGRPIGTMAQPEHRQRAITLSASFIF